MWLASNATLGAPMEVPVAVLDPVARTLLPDCWEPEAGPLNAPPACAPAEATFVVVVRPSGAAVVSVVFQAATMCPATSVAATTFAYWVPSLCASRSSGLENVALFGTWRCTASVLLDWGRPGLSLLGSAHIIAW